MALRLPGHDEGVVPQQPFHQRRVRFGDRRPVRAFQHFRAQHRVVLGERIPPLDLEPRLRRAGDGVEKDRLLDRRHQRMAHPAQHPVVRPDHERVLPLRFEAPAVVERVPRQLLRGEPGGVGGVRIHPQATAFEVVRADFGIGRRRLPVPVQEEVRVEDLDRGVGVEGGHDLGDPAELRVEETAEPEGVLDGAVPRPSGDEQLAARQTEGVLAVHEQQPDPGGVPGRRRDPVGVAPSPRLVGPLLIGHPVQLADQRFLEERRGREFAAHGERNPGRAGRLGGLGGRGKARLPD